MAGGGDISGCVELTAAFVNFNRFQSGLYGISFDITGNASERLWGKDPTVDVTNAVCQLYSLHLSCASGSVQLFDGSGGSHLPGLNVSDASDNVSGNGKTQLWDFGKDPLICLTADNTQSLCISCGNGWVSGFMKVGWGSKS